MNDNILTPETDLTRKKVMLITENMDLVTAIKLVINNINSCIFEFIHILTPDKAQDFFLRNTVDIVLLDLSSTASNVLEILPKIQTLALKSPVITLVKQRAENVGLESLKFGVMDYVIKERACDNDGELAVVISKAMLRAELMCKDALTSTVRDHLYSCQNLVEAINMLLDDISESTKFAEVSLLLRKYSEPSMEYYGHDTIKPFDLSSEAGDNDSILFVPLALYKDILSKNYSGYQNNFTEYGSFWSDDYGDFALKHVGGVTTASSNRNSNYYSLALIPVIIDKRVVGILQLAAATAGKITRKDVGFFEKIARLFADTLKQKSLLSETYDSKLRLLAIYEYVYIGIIVEDVASGRIVFVNARACETLGLPEDVILGKAVDYFFHVNAGNDNGNNLKPYETYIYSAEKAFHVLRSIKTVEISGKKLRINSFSDLTENDKSQEEIIKLSRFPNENPYPVLRVAVSGNILYHNKAGMNFLPYICEEDNIQLNQEYIQLVQDCFKFGELSYQEVSCGEKLYSIYMRPITDEHYVNMYGVDITEQRRIEKQLRHSEKMQAIGQLAGGIAHEFNNQLAVINGFSELVLNYPPVYDSPKYSNMLSEVIKAGERAADLTRQLLTYCRQKDVSLDLININDIISDMEIMLNRIIGEDISLNTELIESPYMIEIDKGQLSDVLINLCANARDAMAQGGKITVATHNGVWDNETADDENIVHSGPYVCMSVTDTGQGMDEETVKRIFEPFFTTKPVGKGTGLGLSMVYGVVKERKGTITVDSIVGQGTTFYICLPATVKKGSGVSNKDDKKVPCSLSGHETIMVVEDENGVLMYVTTVLQDAGYTVLQSNSPSEAVRIFEQNADSVSLILSDVIMPEMSGFDLIKKLKARKPELKAICMSGYSEDLLHKRVDIEYDITIINKPVSPTELLAALNRLIKGKI